MPQSSHYPNESDIAVIGLSGRFPGARNVREFWRNLRNNVESVSFLSDDDLAEAGIDSDTFGDPDYVRAAYLMQDADRFDAGLFGYSPREARFIDPQQRVLLECAWESMEHAGYGGHCKRRTGVYVGSSLNTYLLFTGLAEQFKTEPVLTLMSNDKDFLATRIGYKLELEGPCVTVQTACSTSLVAVHMACQSILAGECDMALAGGVCVKVPLKAGYQYREGGMLSRDGHCRPFDAAATGTIFGSGAGIVVLKRYSDAVLDGDTIHAVVKATAINNDGGRKASYTAPSVNGLAEVISHALDFGQIHPEEIGYVECHGTGTALGDPIEVHALTKAFRAHTEREHYCALASVKSNIGHLESASGIAGLIKAICCLKHRYLPASLHFQRANPALAIQGSPFFVNAENREWVSESPLRTAAVNSLGVGGTNANVIVQEAVPLPIVQSSRRWHFLPISAKSEATAQALKTDILRHIREEQELNLADAAFTLQTGRKDFSVRKAVLADGDGTRVTEFSHPPVAVKSRPLVFLFGDHFDPELRAALSDEEPQFAAAHAGVSTIENLQAGLVQLWRSWGIEAKAFAAYGRGIAGATQTRRSEALEVCDHQAGLKTFCGDLLDRWKNSIFLPLGYSDDLWSQLDFLIGSSKAYTLLHPLKRSEGNPVLLTQAAGLWCAGCGFAESPWYKGEARRRVPLPLTPMSGERHWWTPAARTNGLSAADHSIYSGAGVIPASQLRAS